jgi:hypothetical protein
MQLRTFNSFFMKKALLLLAFIPLSSFAQPWLKFFYPAWVYHVTSSFNKDYDPGYLLTLQAANFSPISNQHTIIEKIDDNGLLIQEIIAGNGPNESSRFDFPYVTIEGELILPGSKWSSNQIEDPILVKLDLCRQKNWCTSLVNNPDWPDFFLDACVTSDGSIVALSMQNDPDNTESFHLHKFTPDGQPLWRKELASPQLHPDIWDPEPWKLLQMPDGDFLVTGNCYWPNPEGGLQKWIRMFLVEADADGNEEWFYVHGINDYIYTMGGISVLYNNKIYTDGAWYNPQNNYPTPQLFVNDLDRNYIYDAPVVIFDTLNRFAANYFIMTDNQDGYFYGSAKMYLPNTYEDTRPVMIKIDTLGNVLDLFITETQPPLYWAGLPSLTLDGKIIVAGACAGTNPDYDDVYAMRLLPELELDSIPWSNLNYDTLCPEPIVSHVISLDDCLIVVSNEDYKPPVKQTELKITPAPVPANSTLRLLYENTLRYRNINVKCYNSIGKEITAFTINSGVNETTLDVVNWSPGLYMVVAFSGSKAVGRCKFIVE